MVTAWEILKGEVKVGNRVVVADWRGDWVGCGIAELLASNGHSVRLFVSGTQLGDKLEAITRYTAIARLFRLGVEIIPNTRLFGVDAESVYLQHTITDDPMVCDGVDSLVLAMGHEPDTGLAAELDGIEAEVISIGDCLAPRTAEEAVIEGLQVACRV